MQAPTNAFASLQEPLLSSLIDNRRVALAITGIAIAQPILTYLELPGWACPTLTYLNCPCPGCGLTRAVVALAQGDWATMAQYHIFAPVFVVGFMLIAAGAVLPTTQRNQLVALTTMLEQKFALTGVFFIVLLAYWLVRLVFFYEPYFALVSG